MNEGAIVRCKTTPEGVFIPCPICRNGKIMRVFPETSAANVGLYCRRCKQESVVDIQPGRRLDRVTFKRTG